MNPNEIAARYWLAACFERQLDDGPVGVTILGRAIVVGRLDDAVVALPDRCSHRGARLSDGHIASAPFAISCLVCPYHGLHFDHDGHAIHLPARRTDRLPSRLDLAPYSVEVRHGIVWISLAENPVGGIPDWSAFDQSVGPDPDLVGFQLGPEPWEVMPTRIVENFNDLAHFSTVHAGTFGDPDHPEVPPIEVCPTEVGFDHSVVMHQMDRVTLDGPLVPVPVTFSYSHVFPYATELVIDYDNDRREWIQMVVSPVSATRSVVFQQNVRNFDLDDDPAVSLAAKINDWHDFQLAVNDEDRLILEAIEPREIPLGSGNDGEIALSFDTVTVAYRRAWRNLFAP